MHTERMTQCVENLRGEWHARHLTHEVSRECDYTGIGARLRHVVARVLEEERVLAQLAGSQMPQSAA